MTAMATFNTAPPLRIHAESETLEKLMSTTIHTKASSMPRTMYMFISMPNTMLRISGNNVAKEAIHRGKFSQ